MMFSQFLGQSSDEVAAQIAANERALRAASVKTSIPPDFETSEIERELEIREAKMVVRASRAFLRYFDTPPKVSVWDALFRTLPIPPRPVDPRELKHACNILRRHDIDPDEV